MKRLLILAAAFVSTAFAGSGTDPCTPTEFQTLLDDMITTGGQYLEVFPVNVAQFPDAFTEAQARLNSVTNAPYHGIYVVTHNLHDANATLPDSIYATPSIDGIVLRTLWSQIEPAPDTYDWSIVDVEINRAVASKKKLAVHVSAGVYTPAWLYGAPYNVPNATFLWGHHNSGCAPTVLPAPYDPQYEQAYANMMLAYAQHLHSIPGAYEATQLAGLTGINTLTGELHLAFCKNSNGLALWQGLGYTPDKLIAAGEALMNAVATAFPDKVLNLAILESGGLPTINNAGQIVSKDDPTYVDVKQQLINYGLATYAGRFAVQWNGFVDAADAAPSVLAAGQAGAIIGWNSNEFGGRKKGAKCK